MTRGCAPAFVAFAGAMAVQLLGAHSVEALGSAREGARDALLRAVNGHWYHGDSDADYHSIHAAWSAFADMSHLTAASTRDPAAASTTFFEQACQPGGILDDFSRTEPAPGDLVLYHVTGESRARLAMFVSPADVVLYNPTTADLEMHVRQEVTGYDGEGPRVVGGVDAHVACRFRTAVLPGGVDDVMSLPGRVALVDPQRTLEHAAWAYAHPRDPDHSAWHQLTKTLTGAASWLGSGLLWIADHAGRGLRSLLEHLGWFGAAVLGVFDLTFDGRLLHAVLTWGLLVMTGTLGLRLASRVGIPFLGRAGDTVWGIGSFIVFLLTGVGDSRRVSVLGVAVNVLLTVTVVGKLAGVGARLAGLATAELAQTGAARVSTLTARGLVRLGPLAKRTGQLANRSLGALNHLSNAIDVRPRSIVGIFDRAAARPPWWDVTDYVSWLWRPGHIATDLVSDAANAAGVLGSSEGAAVGEYNKLYSGAHTLGTVSTGQPLSTPVPVTIPHGPDSTAADIRQLLHDEEVDEP